MERWDVYSLLVFYRFFKMMFWDVEVRNRTPHENVGENVRYYNQLPW
jgi:hypothetical protein